MASSTFEVRESESDGEKVIDFGLDTCEENGIMSTSIDGELPKDHTYTKGPDVLQGFTFQDEEQKDVNDEGNQLDEMDGNISLPEKSRPSRATKAKTVKKTAAKPKAKKNSPAKKEAVSRRNKSKKDEVTVEPDAEAEVVAANGELEETSEDVSVAETKPAKRGRKRKIEEKENVLEQSTENSTAEDADKEEPPAKRQTTRTIKSTKVDKSPKRKVAVEGITDTLNLPKGWIRKTVERKSGKTAGLVDIYIYSPDGYKFRSKPDIAAYLIRTKSTLKLDNFDFSRKKLSSDVPNPSPPTKKKAVVVKPKTPSKKKALASKRAPKLLVKMVSEKVKRNRAARKSQEKKDKATKAPVKGKKGTKAASKGSKKRKSS